VIRRCVSHRCKSCLRNCRCISVATEAAGRVTNRLKLSGQRPTMGGSASRRAVTCVKPEQASKVMMRGPTGLNNREGLPGGRQAAGGWGLTPFPASARGALSPYGAVSGLRLRGDGFGPGSAGGDRSFERHRIRRSDADCEWSPPARTVDR
jgi:hypothetical protein